MKKAFTLTEILLSMAIAGVITVFMLIQIRANSVKQNVLLYKKTFTDLQQVVSRIAGDTSLFPVPEDGLMRRPTNIGVANDEEDAQYFCEQLTNNLITDLFDANNERIINCNVSNRTDAGFTPNITLSNGVQIAGLPQIFANGDFENFIEDYIDICVDTNGNARPNLGCDTANIPTKDRDRYRIRIYYTGKVTLDRSWGFENAIFEEQDRATELRSEEFPDIAN